MGCLFAIFAAFTPRLAFLFLWIFTPLVNRAFTGIILPILGLIFLPFTTLIYILVYNPTFGLTGWDWLWIILAFLLDIGAYGASAYTNKDRFGETQTTSQSPPAQTA